MPSCHIGNHCHLTRVWVPKVALSSKALILSRSHSPLPRPSACGELLISQEWPLANRLGSRPGINLADLGPGSAALATSQAPGLSFGGGQDGSSATDGSQKGASQSPLRALQGLPLFRE